MAETSLTKVTSSGYGVGVVDVGYEAVDQANGNTFANTGSTVFSVKNASAGTVQVTFTTLANRHTVNAAQSIQPATVAAGDTGSWQLSVAIFGSAPVINYDTGTTITASVVEYENIPV